MSAQHKLTMGDHIVFVGYTSVIEGGRGRLDSRRHLRCTCSIYIEEGTCYEPMSSMEISNETAGHSQ